MAFGALTNNVWPFASADNSDKPQVNQMLLKPFFNYNFRKGWYLTSATIITANWKADDREQWVVPMGGGGGKIFKSDKQAMNAQAMRCDLLLINSWVNRGNERKRRRTVTMKRKGTKTIKHTAMKTSTLDVLTIVPSMANFNAANLLRNPQSQFAL